MKSGKLDRLVTIQRRSSAQSNSGEHTETWTDLVARLPASQSPIRGDERFSAPQWIAKEQIEFRIRYSPAYADISPVDRLIYPAPTVDSPTDIPERSIFDIMAFHEIGRMEGFKILAVRRADV